MGFKGGFVIRSYVEEGELSDRAQVMDLERRCEIGPSKRVFLFTDTLGDPICRIRNSPMYKMLVAEWDKEVVGVVQGSIKAVFSTAPHKEPLGLAAKVGYILGLRVAPPYRRRGIGSGLVRRLEDWFASNDVDYCCMATEKDNHASVNLFINNLRYLKFRTGRILVNPVTNRPYQINPSEINIEKLRIEAAEAIYKKHMASTEFFPKDINSILKNKLSLGTWVANFKQQQPPWSSSGGGSGGENGETPSSWAVVSLWNSGQVFKLRLGKAPFPWLVYTKSLKAMDKLLPCFKVVLVPDFYKPFGFYFVYGLHHEGPFSEKLVRALCQFVHNMALNNSRDNCKVIVTEIGGDDDELKMEIPHWKFLSCSEDLWCIKALKNEEINNNNHNNHNNNHNHNHNLLEWINAPPNRTLFVDPREV